MNIKNQTALITGGGSGLGATTAKHLAALGAKIIIIDLDPKAQIIAQECDGQAFNVDVANPTSVEEIFAKIDSPRIVVNCAGIAPAKKIVGKNGVMPLQDFQHVIDVNLLGTFNILRLAAAYMQTLATIPETEERGVIINTASIAAYEGQIGQCAYAASKAGIVGLTLPAARELSPFGIRVMTIAPGLMATPMLLNMSEKVQESLQKDMLFPHRFGNPEEYAALVEHIIINSMLNGSVVRLDGALRLA